MDKFPAFAAIFAGLLGPAVVCAETIFSTTCKVSAEQPFLAENTVYVLTIDAESQKKCFWKFVDWKIRILGCGNIREKVAYESADAIYELPLAKAMLELPFKLNFPYDHGGYVDMATTQLCPVNYGGLRGESGG